MGTKTGDSGKPMAVFYSWQSDLPGKTNRHFIHDALKEACAQLEKQIEEAVRPDSDTKDTPGARDIHHVILEKIAAADAVVFDVTPVAVAANGKKVPNPNVMLELGYALVKPGVERLVLVLNTAHAEDNREGLERLAYRMKRPSASGATSLEFTPIDFLRRVAALIPPPRVNLVRFFGLCGAPHNSACSPPTPGCARSWSRPRRPSCRRNQRPSRRRCRPRRRRAKTNLPWVLPKGFRPRPRHGHPQESPGLTFCNERGARIC